MGFSRHRWTWDVTTDSPLTRLAMAQAATKASCFRMMAGQNYIEECTLTWGARASEVYQHFRQTTITRTQVARTGNGRYPKMGVYLQY